MLNSALSSVNELLIGNPRLLDRLQNGDNQLVKEIIDCWDNAAFSEMTDHTLRRFFSYEVQAYCSGIENLDGVDDLPVTLLSEPIDHLKTYYRGLFNDKLIAPDFYLKNLQDRLENKVKAALAKVFQVEIGISGLAYYINNFLVHTNGKITYTTADYFIKVIDAILESEYSSDSLLSQLIKVNFNHLDFYSDLQDEIQNQMEELLSQHERKIYLREKLQWIKSLPENITWCYDESFPSLKSLLVGWVEDLIASQTCDHLTAPQEKLKIKLPASELACFLFASSSQGWYDDRTLQSVFHFISVHFSSKHKENLSQKNLSKEYYSITQQTAARTRERLQQMISAINKRYFPA